jgi:hypothetical protein
VTVQGVKMGFQRAAYVFDVSMATILRQEKTKGNESKKKLSIFRRAFMQIQNELVKHCMLVGKISGPKP